MLSLLMQNMFAQQNKAILPIPYPPSDNQTKVNLGKILFKENLFSKNNTLSCNSCHMLNKGGDDNIPKYVGLDKKIGLINTPTILNASLNFRQFWDGRVKTLAAVIEDHLHDPTIFANNWETIINRINSDPKLYQAYQSAYNHAMSSTEIKEALTLYINTLLTPDSPFDRFLQGDKSALSEEAKKGFELFKSYGCITCHQGPGIGGNLYQKFGIYKDYFATKKTINKADFGLYNVTGKPEDKYVFVVPSLRNVALTAPYLHDGSAATLEEVIQLMGIYQVGQPIQKFDVPYIVKFLQSLTGKLPNE
ncbi:MAG: c-type cytochrome [Proteobacteria bacterium]|nr:c-type cytochrome [Pseudomonadota bacterium]